MYIMAGPKRVGVRELRQNVSAYLARVKRGETIEVTEHGHPVALLAPLRADGDPLARLIASGRATAPSGTLDEIPAPRGRPTTTLSRALDAERAERV